MFTKSDVDYLVAATKFVRAIPAPRPPDLRGGGGQRIQIDVFRRSEPGAPVNGLIVIATARPAPPGLPKPIPSAALVWHGRRIRGLNYEQWHDNPDGSVVKGWHEHLWTLYEDSYVVSARPEPSRKTLVDILKWGLVKWNIDVLEQQLEV